MFPNQKEKSPFGTRPKNQTMDSIFNQPKPKVTVPDEVKSALVQNAKHYPLPAGKVFQYGTAGFRMKADDGLDHVVYATGIVAALRSKRRNEAYIGVMITASHNPAQDNGVKVVDPMGDMLEQEWEEHASQLANTDNEQFGNIYEELTNDLLIDPVHQVHTRKSRVVFARDTRASGPHLIKALKASLDALNVEYTDYGILTTPMLHHMVRCLNTKNTKRPFGEASEEGYYKKMADAFKKAMYGRKISGHLTVDCANGVGGPKLHELLKYLPNAANGGLDIKVVNDDVIKPEALNFECGADFVKTKQRAPPSSNATPLERCCSLDGDADRIVYYFIDDNKEFHLLDGDRIATLAANFIADQARVAGIGDKVKIGVVQTAYANGASTEYIHKVMKLPVDCTPTGVKHLHHAAKRFDIGVYFEANGHGTVLFNDTAIETIERHEPQSPGQKHALESLAALIDLINQAVGDAFSDMLLTEVALAHRAWSPQDWLNTYIDLPNKLVRVVVPDRNVFKAVDAERKLESPPGAQAKIDQYVNLTNRGRSFARASGTEDAVRVYAEAHSSREAEKLANQVAEVVELYGRRSAGKS